jgi:hypothetical protein
VFGAGEHALRAAEFAILQPSDRRRPQFSRKIGRFAEGLIRASPALVARRGDRRRERPIRPDAEHFERGDPRCFFDEGRVTRRAEPDVVRKDDRVDDVIVSVNRVETVKQPHVWREVLGHV